MKTVEDLIREQIEDALDKRLAEYTCPRCDLLATELPDGFIMCIICGDTPSDWPHRDH